MDDQFNNWVGQWEKALEDGVFNNSGEEKSMEIELPKNSKESFFGNLEINTEFNPNQEDIEYWNGINNYTESEIVLNESKKHKEDKQKERIKKVAKSANPVGIDTIGKDNAKFSKDLILNKDIEKLAELKKKIYELENEILSKETLGKDYSKAEKALKKITKLMDEISDSISPERLDSSTES